VENENSTPTDETLQERSQEVFEQAVEEEPQVAKLVRPADLGEKVKEWKLTSFEDDSSARAVDSLSSEVLNRMQNAMRPQLQRQTELLKKEAYEEAYQKGYEFGLNQGLEEGRAQGEADAKAEIQKQLEPKLEQFESLLTALQKPYDLIEEKLYSEMVELALHISETVVSKSIADNREWVLDAVHEAVAQLPESKSEINVYLNPEDLAFIQISKPTISEKWLLHENPNISIGSCLVKQDHSSVLNDWKNRFTDISNQLAEGLAVDKETSATEE